MGPAPGKTWVADANEAAKEKPPEGGSRFKPGSMPGGFGWMFSPRHGHTGAAADAALREAGADPGVEHHVA